MIDIYKLPSVEMYGSNCYLISSGGEYAVIDPSADYLSAVKKYPELDGKLKLVLITHTHFDHMLTIDDWSKACGGAVYVGEDDADGLSDSMLNCYLGFLGINQGYYGSYHTLSDGDTLKLGDDEISVIACPGHTKGGVSYKVGDKIFCGDTVFAGGGYGRCDLPGGDIDVLEKTLIRLITHINDGVFYPGHGPTATLEEIVYNFM